MRLLFLTCHLPYPPHSGGRLREHELLARLTQRFDVHIAAVTKTLAEDEEAAADIPWDHNGISLFPAAALDSLPGVAPQVARHRSEAATAGIRGSWRAAVSTWSTSKASISGSTSRARGRR